MLVKSAGASDGVYFTLAATTPAHPKNPEKFAFEHHKLLAGTFIRFISVSIKANKFVPFIFLVRATPMGAPRQIFQNRKLRMAKSILLSLFFFFITGTNTQHACRLAYKLNKSCMPNLHVMLNVKLCLISFRLLYLPVTPPSNGS